MIDVDSPQYRYCLSCTDRRTLYQWIRRCLDV